MRRLLLAFLSSSALTLCVMEGARAQALTLNLEVHFLPVVGASWQTVSLENTYTNPVVVCSYNLPSKTDPPATTRVRNAGSNSFEVRVQKFETSNTVTASGVHCIVAEEGSYNLPNGLAYEAYTVLSDGTSGQAVPNDWTSANTEEVTSQIVQSYTNPVVLGQVMTYNDPKASVFWTNNCVTRLDPPFQNSSRICVGKHIGKISGTRQNETIGYIIAEAGSGTLNEMAYELALGDDTVAGVGDLPPYSYSVAKDYDIGIISQNGSDGSEGGWAVLYGSDPLPNTMIDLAIEEEDVVGSTIRAHTTEQVSYWVFQDNQTGTINAAQNVAVSSLSTSPYALPGSDMLYTISAMNIGSKPVDTDTIFIVGAVPTETTLYYGDIDGPGPEAGIVLFAETGSGLSFAEATDLGFSNSSAKPASFADCTYAPSTGYDPNVTFICFSPKGTFNSGSFSSSNFSVTFRVRID